MAYQFRSLGLDHPDLAGNGQRLRERLAHHRASDAPRLKRLWDYYRNPRTPHHDGQTSSRPYRQAQEYGLPARITANTTDIDIVRKEVVIENDIAWRIDAMIDFLFGQPLVINSAAPNPERRIVIETLIRQILSRHGGVGFFQKIALLGAVYGYVDILVKFVGEEERGASIPGACHVQQLGEPTPRDDASENDAIDFERLAAAIRFEIVEPTRGLPIVSCFDPGEAVGFVQHFESASRNVTTETTWIDALKQALIRSHTASGTESVRTVEVLTPQRWQRYENEHLVEEGENSLGRLPLVHIQNVAVPFAYEGASDVEPLVPLQDELNTRLCDRAYRITMQSFKMYLGKGIDDFTKLPIGPGRMYTTDNENAQIIEFGGDSACPNEQAHIDEIREALDKTSGVSPIAAGAIKGRIGRLSSAAAMRVTLLALLGRTERKRTTYGPAIAQLCELSLAWLDRAGLFATSPAERRVEIHWPNPIPANAEERVGEAKAKKELGVDPKVIARELGYPTNESDSRAADVLDASSDAA
jgi:hypothetical protein